MDLDAAVLVGVELLHDQHRVLLDALEDLGELFAEAVRSEDLTTQEKVISIDMTGCEQTTHYVASTVITRDSILRAHLSTL